MILIFSINCFCGILEVNLCWNSKFDAVVWRVVLPLGFAFVMEGVGSIALEECLAAGLRLSRGLEF